MPTWKMEDDILEPNEKLKIDYKGPDPYGAYKKLKGIVTKALQISSSKYRESDFRWDSVTDPRKFYIRVHAKRPLDSRSSLFFEFIFQGKQPIDTKADGELNIQMKGKLTTSYKLKTGFQKSSIYRGWLIMYNKIFYWKIRRQYLQMGKRMMYEIFNEYKKILKFE